MALSWPNELENQNGNLKLCERCIIDYLMRNRGGLELTLVHLVLLKDTDSNCF